MGVDCFDVTVRIHHETGNFASPIPIVKNIEETLEKLKRHLIQTIKPIHNLQVSRLNLAPTTLKISGDSALLIRRVMQSPYDRGQRP